MMKAILPAILALSTLWAVDQAVAEETSNVVCSNTFECTYVDKQQLLPELDFANQPQYVALGKNFNTGGERAFVFSPRYKQWAAYDSDGYRVATGIANGGADFCPDLGRRCHTPAGHFRIHTKKSASCVSNKFPLGRGGAPMPYCMFFKGGYAIHGSPYISNRNGSHGCIRVKTSAARWLHRYFLKHGTKVIVLSY